MTLLICEISFAISNEQAIQEYFKNRKLDKVEGLWERPADKFGPPDTVAINKMGNSYAVIRLKNNDVVGEFDSSNSNRYSGICTIVNYARDNKTVLNTFANEDLRLLLVSNNRISWNCDYNISVQGQSASGTISANYTRVWPSDINSYNAKFNNEPEKKIEIATMINEAKATCKLLGMKEDTQQFSDCALKLYTQSLDIAAKEKQKIVQSKTKTVTGNSSSGSNVMTIYDPVRDNNALMKKGQKMLSGGCTLGVNC